MSSDNPRSEDPLKIIQDITKKMGTNFFIEPDREKAISMALDMAKPDDCVLIAGKGHEKYQIKNNVYLPFDDVEKVKSKLKK